MLLNFKSLKLQGFVCWLAVDPLALGIWFQFFPTIKEMTV